MVIRLAGAGRREPDPDRARLAISSGRQTEKVLDGPAGGHSPFAEAFLTALKHGVPGANRPDYFTATELYSFLEGQVHSRHPGQRPLFAQLANHEGGEVVFGRPRV